MKDGRLIQNKTTKLTNQMIRSIVDTSISIAAPHLGKKATSGD